MWWNGARAKIPEQQRQGLPVFHPACLAAEEHFTQLIEKHAPDRILRYPALVTLLVAASKRLMEAITDDAAPFFDKESPLLSEIGSAFEFGPVDAPIFHSFCEKPDRVLELDRKAIWENGFSAGVALAEELSKKPKAPRRRNLRSNAFWLTFHAWVIVKTNRELSGQRPKLKGEALLIKVLATLGVVEGVDSLSFPNGSGKKPKRMKLTTFRDNLTDWSGLTSKKWTLI